MEKYQCSVCYHIYDPQRGDSKSGTPPGTAFEDLPDDWVCPMCRSKKSRFGPYRPRRFSNQPVK